VGRVGFYSFRPTKPHELGGPTWLRVLSLHRALGLFSRPFFPSVTLLLRSFHARSSSKSDDVLGPVQHDGSSESRGLVDDLRSRWVRVSFSPYPRLAYSTCRYFPPGNCLPVSSAVNQCQISSTVQFLTGRDRAIDFVLLSPSAPSVSTIHLFRHGTNEVGESFDPSSGSPGRAALC